MKIHIWSLFLLVVLFGLILHSCEGQLFKNLFGKLYGKLSKNGKHHGKHHGKNPHNQPERSPLVIDDQEGMYQDFVKNVLPFLPTPAPAPYVPPQKKDEPILKHFPGPVGPNGLPLPPYIRLGGLVVPTGFRVVNNFKESFEVRLPPIISHSPNQPYPWDKTVKNLGSIMSQSKIYISPEYPVLQRQPNLVTTELRAPSFSDSEAVVNLFNSVSDIMREKVKQVSKYQYRSFQEEQEVTPVEYDPSSVERPVVIVHLQSYSSLRPNLTGVDEDVADAQRTYGFGCGAFEFGKTDTVARILSSLRQSNIEPIDINEIGGSQDEINDNVFFRFNKFVNSTRKVHLWAHTRSEVDAVKRFRLPFLEGGYGEGPTGKSFQDTAPVTDTLAVAFL